MKRIYGISATVLVLFGALVAIDTFKGDEPFDIASFALDVFEKGLLALAVLATAYVALEIKGLKRERLEMLNDLSRVRGESDRWRAQARVHVEGLGRAIRDQFKVWRLSESEADIALLMLKGMTQKEIAHLRGSEEATVRQQAAAVYRKAGLANRSELSAYFLEDLLSPEADRAANQSEILEIVKIPRE
jgi:DNA-binding CsgD family transcriptional regulator